MNDATPALPKIPVAIKASRTFVLALAASRRAVWPAGVEASRCINAAVSAAAALPSAGTDPANASSSGLMPATCEMMSSASAETGKSCVKLVPAVFEASWLTPSNVSVPAN